MVHPVCRKWQDFLFLWLIIIIQCVRVCSSHFLDLFIPRWTCRLFPFLGSCEQCCRTWGYRGNRRLVDLLLKSIILGDVGKMSCMKGQINSTDKCYRCSKRVRLLWLGGLGKCLEKMWEYVELCKLSGIQKSKWEGEDITIRENSVWKAVIWKWVRNEETSWLEIRVFMGSSGS